ncbi:MAG: hypothetical protein JWP68_3657 [Modestobacter sp.]|nr:hypothetical protein [Modestobacter sp.]
MTHQTRARRALRCAAATWTGPGQRTIAIGLLVRRRRRRQAVLVAGARMIGGWGSNLLDRLGLHRATAPGSARGAVDPAPNGVPVVVMGGAAAIAASHDVGVDSSPRPPAETAGHV